MWPWRSPSEFRDFEERLDKLERANRETRLEYENLYDKVLRALQRITKRAEVVERAEGAAEVGQELPPGMTPRAWEAQRTILANRGKRVLSG